MSTLNDVRVFGFVGPPDSTDDFASHDSVYGRGGWREVVDHVARNAITEDRRRQGMSVLTQNDIKVWLLKASPWDGTDDDWILFNATAAREYLFLMGAGVDLATGSNVAAFYSILPYDGTFVRFDLAAKVGPVGSSSIFDVLKSSNHGSTWTSLWITTPSDRPTIADGSAFAGGTDFDTISFSGGDWLRIDIIQVGSTTPGQGVTLSLTVSY